MKHLLFAAALIFTANMAVADRSADTLYNQSCIACHASGAAGAPRTGDVETWQKKLDEKGMETLVANTLQGINGMPPRGMCMDCTESEFEALIELMAKPAN